MGIKSLTKLIKQKAPESIVTSQYHKLSGKRIAIDASLYIYQCLMNVRHDGKYLTNDDDKVTSHISGLFYKNINLLSNNIKISLITIVTSSKNSVAMPRDLDPFFIVSTRGTEKKFLSE